MDISNTFVTTQIVYIQYKFYVLISDVSRWSSDIAYMSIMGSQTWRIGLMKEQRAGSMIIDQLIIFISFMRRMYAVHHGINLDERAGERLRLNIQAQMLINRVYAV